MCPDLVLVSGSGIVALLRVGCDSSHGRTEACSSQFSECAGCVLLLDFSSRLRLEAYRNWRVVEFSSEVVVGPWEWVVGCACAAEFASC